MLTADGVRCRSFAARVTLPLRDVRTGERQSETVLHLGLKRGAIDRHIHGLIAAIVVITIATTVAGILLAFVLARRSTREIHVLVEALRSYGTHNNTEEPVLHATSSDVMELVRHENVSDRFVICIGRRPEANVIGQHHPRSLPK